MAGFGEIFGMGQTDFQHPIARGQDGMSSVGKPLMDFRGNPLFSGDKGNPMGQGSSSMNQAEAAGALTPPDDGMSNQTMGAIMGATQAVAGVMGQHQAYKAQKRALKLKQSEMRINKIFAKGAFDRKMTSLFQAHKDLDEQSMQQHNQREAAYKQKMGSLKVMQAERGMEGTSAGETREALTRSNLMAETVMLSNLKKAQRSLMYQREGIADERVAQELGFDMANANIQSQLSMPSWAQMLMDVPDLAIGGMNTYFNFVRNSGRSGQI